MDSQFSSTARILSFGAILTLLASSSTGQTPPSLVPAWVQHYGADRSANTTTRSAAIATDGSGNIYTLCHTSTTLNGRDYQLIKYTGTGAQQWVRTYNGPGDYDDVPVSVLTDRDGNVYVTGTSYDDMTNYDLCTFKYSPSGDVLWMRRYNHPGNKAEVATTMQIDNSGNILIGGYIVSQYSWSVISSSNGEEFLTVKYDPSGNLLWSRTFSGGSGSFSTLHCAAVDSSGNIFVSGATPGQRTTVKYSPSGDQLWTASASIGGEPGPEIRIGVDADGNCYIAGHYPFYFNETEMYAIKYSPSGTEMWARPVPGKPGRATTAFRGMTVDKSGAVYVIGRTWDYNSPQTTVTAKISPSGGIRWTRFAPGNHNEPYAISLAENQKLRIVGKMGANVYLLNYDTSGSLQWTKAYTPTYSVSGADIVTRGNGYAFIAGTAGVWTGNCFTFALSPDSAVVWNALYTGDSLSSDNVVGATFGNGKLIVTASSRGESTNGGRNILTLAYTPTGTKLWTTHFAESSFTQTPSLVKYDGTSSYYVIGSSATAAGSDALTLKYDGNGMLLWSARYSIPGSTQNTLSDATLDATGNFYATGHSILDRGRFLTLKYNSNGANLLAMHELIPWNDWPEASSIALDSTGNIHIGGKVWRSANPPDPNTTHHLAASKYTPDGVLQWIHYQGGSIQSGGLFGKQKVCVDPAGNVYLAGTTLPASNTQAITTVKYAPDGTPQWVDTLNGAHNVIGLFVTPSGRIVVGGTTTSGTNFIVACYDPSGSRLWRTIYDSPYDPGYGGMDDAKGMIIDAQGNTYITGQTAYRYRTTIKISPSGAVIWTARYIFKDGLGNPWSEDGALALDDGGNLYVVASTSRSSSKFITVLKYEQPPTSVERGHEQTPNLFYLSQNYPNPFNPSTTIRFSVGTYGHTSLRVFDLLGREVATLVDEKMAPGSYERVFNAEGLASGIYLYRLSAGTYSQTRKLILLR